MRSRSENADRSEDWNADRLVAAARWILALAAGCALAAPAPETIDQAVAESEQSDPGSPQALNSRLDYAAELVADELTDCHERLDVAQSQLDTAAGSQSFDVVLPLGPARLADIEYRIHMARATCGADQALRANELRQAQSAAERAVSAYRGALDYKSMAVMQFNLAAVQRLSGADATAAASLAQAIAQDEELGFTEDRQENTALLSLWTVGVHPATSVAPPRTVELKLGSRRDGLIDIQLDDTHVVEGKLTHSHKARSVKLRHGSTSDPALTAQDSDFLTKVWADARLDQGVWYNLQADLLLPGYTEEMSEPHDVEFAYVRDVPCTDTATERRCVELVVHATPELERLGKVLARLNRHYRTNFHYWSTMYMRIVTEPETLTTHSYEVRRYWHASDPEVPGNKLENHYQRLVATFSYPEMTASARASPR